MDYLLKHHKPTNYIGKNGFDGVSCDDLFNGVDDNDIPIIDYSMLTSRDPTMRSNQIQILGDACLDYGFFIVTNHNVPRSLIKNVIDQVFEFFDLPEEEKRKYETNNPTDTIRSGKGDFNLVTREFFKVAVHPQFHCPSDPPALREVLEEYHEKLREMGLVLLRGISKSLGQDEHYIENSMKLDSGYSFFTANDYPPRQKSEKRVGQFPHVDPGLLILLLQNITGGLQLRHNGKWVNADVQPDSIIVNIADHLEILTNGKYQSTIHRVIVNNEERRATLPLFMGPSLDTLVKPAPEFVGDNEDPSYIGMTYKQYLQFNKFHVIDGKSCLNQIRLL